jgi:uncharacterized SAM-binding protein YcdF (DUF218 family)
MIFLSKVFTYLILPPGCFIFILFLVFIFIPKKKKIFPLLSLLILYLLSIQPFSDLLLKPLENAYPPLSSEFKKDWPQAVVILGGGIIQASPEAGAGKDALTSDAMKRVVYAYSLRDTFKVPFIFSGGKTFEYGQEPEAFTASRLFVSLGLPFERLVLESRSRNTWENAKETAIYGFEKIVLITSAYHVKRSVYCFNRQGISVIAAPTDYKCDRGRKYNFFSFMPTITSLNNSYLALHEYIGLLIYKVIYR